MAVPNFNITATPLVGSHTEPALALIHSLERLVNTYHRAHEAMGILINNLELIRKQQTDIGTYRTSIISELDAKNRHQNETIKVLEERLAVIERENNGFRNYIEDLRESSDKKIPSSQSPFTNELPPLQTQWGGFPESAVRETTSESSIRKAKRPRTNDLELLVS